jgi:hypothetical protein
MRRSDYTGDGEILANRDRQTAGGTVVWADEKYLRNIRNCLAGRHPGTNAPGVAKSNQTGYCRFVGSLRRWHPV